MPDDAVTERAELTVKAGHEAQFEAAIAATAPLIRTARGVRGLRLERTVEHPSVYTLVVEWAHIDDHVVTYRSSATPALWYETVGPHLAAPPEVRHLSHVLTGF